MAALPYSGDNPTLGNLGGPAKVMGSLAISGPDNSLPMGVTLSLRAGAMTVQNSIVLGGGMVRTPIRRRATVTFIK